MKKSKIIDLEEDIYESDSDSDSDIEISKTKNIKKMFLLKNQKQNLKKLINKLKHGIKL